MPSVSSRHSRRRSVNEINMVPFIDVMLVLLIIFMVTAPLITPSMIDLPSVGRANRLPDRKIEIVVRKDESLELKLDSRTQRLPLRDVRDAVLKAQAAQPAGGTAVVISADRNVRYESVVKLMDALQKAGVQRVGLSVQLAP
jgi:biopolymer transport protein TolR